MSLIDLASHVQAEGLGVMGESLFIQYEIDQLRPGITLRQTGGIVSPYAPGLRRLTFQAVVRHATYPSGLAQAEALMEALTILHSQVGTVFVLECRPKHEPIPFDRDNAGINSFVLNFGIFRHR